MSDAEAPQQATPAAEPAPVAPTPTKERKPRKPIDKDSDEYRRRCESLAKAREVRAMKKLEPVAAPAAKPVPEPDSGSSSGDEEESLDALKVLWDNNPYNQKLDTILQQVTQLKLLKDKSRAKKKASKVQQQASGAPQSIPVKRPDPVATKAKHDIKKMAALINI